MTMAGVKRSITAMLGHEGSHPQSPAIAFPRSLGFHSASSTSPTHYTPNERTPARTPNRTPARTPEPTTRTPSPRLTPFTARPSSFGCDASIILVGIRGCGKSTLAIMAASAMNRKVIDMEAVFHQVTGASSSVYKKSHGSSQCYEEQAKVLEETLVKNKHNAIIVCSWMETSVQRLMREFATTNPAVHVVRDSEALQRHLKIDDRGKMDGLITVSNTIFRSCTNFEFFNLSETQRPRSEGPDQRLPAPSLTLKGAERHFLKFLSQILPAGAIPFIDSAFLLATIPTEQRLFTYAISVPLADVLGPDFDIEEHNAGADAVQIEVSASRHHETWNGHSSTLSLETDITRAVATVRRSTVLPIIVNVALPEFIDAQNLSEYFSHVAHALRAAPEMASLDLRCREDDLATLLSIKGRSKIIGDYSFSSDYCPGWDLPFWHVQYSRAVSLNFDLVRFLRPAKSLRDNFAVARLRASIEAREGSHLPLIAYNTGRTGRNSACFNPVLTVVERKECELNDHSSNLTAHAASLALSASFVYDPMKLYVFGARVDYSMSPAMHNAALTGCGMPHRYEPYSTNSLSGLRHLIQDPHFGGASIGLPFKVEIISLTHSLSRHAQAIGAVNTLIPVRHLDANGDVPQGCHFFENINRAGPVKALYGENTDWIGIRACIRRGLSPANAVRQGTCGLIIGAGGMARAALYAMLQVGVQNVVIYNRTVSRAERFADHFRQLLQKEEFQSLGAGRQTKFHILRSLDAPWPADLNLPTIIISCIPTHRIGDVPAPDFRAPNEWLGSRIGGVIIELGYKTLDTPLLAQARSKASQGWVAMDGLDLLPDQGFAQFELFTGRRAPRRVMRRDLLKAYADAHGKSEREEIGPRLGSLNEPEA